MGMKGKLALCSQGLLGLITQDEPQWVTYGPGEFGLAYVGIHLTDKKCPVGWPWCSRTPHVIFGLEDVFADMGIPEDPDQRAAAQAVREWLAR
jgi:hypothetical protein